MHKEILKHIDEREVVEFAKGIAKFPSFSGEEKEVAEWLAEQMEGLGYEVELQEVEPNRPNVIGRIRGSGEGHSFMFNGHTDIDPVAMGIPGDPFDIHVEGRRLFGHGLNNMKGGDTAMIMAGAAIKRANIPLKGDLVVALVVGELQGGIGTVDLLERGIVTDFAIVPEPTLLHIRTIHASVYEFLINTIGEACWIGTTHKYRHVNAVEKMCKVVEAINNMDFTYTPRPDLPELPKKLTSNIMGGLTRDYRMWRPAYVPDFCTLTVDVRGVPGQTLEMVHQDLERTLKDLQKKDPDLKYEIEPPPAIYRKPWQGMKYAMPPLDLPLDNRLVQVVSRNHKLVTGEDAPGVGFYDPGSYAGADSGHLFQAGCACLNYGPTGHNIMDHSMSIDLLMTGTKVMALSAAEILTEAKGS